MMDNIQQAGDGLQFDQDYSHSGCLSYTSTPFPAIFSAGPAYSAWVGDLENGMA